MAKKKSRSTSHTAKVVAALLVVALASCRHVPEVMYQEVFSPPGTYLDVTELDSTFKPDSRVVDRAVEIGQENGFNLKYVGAIRKAECGGVCYVLREPHTDHVYVVFLTTDQKIEAWMSFSQLENGR